MNRLRILLVTHSYPPYTPSGSGPSNDWARIAKRLAAKGWEVTVLCGLTKTPSVSKEDSVSVIRVPFPDIPPRALWFQVRNAGYILEMMKRNDIMLAYWDSVPLLLPRLAKIGKPVVCMMPGTLLRSHPKPKLLDVPLSEFLYDLLNEFLGRWFGSRDLQFATHIATDSRHAIKDLERAFNVHLRDKCFVFGRGPITLPSRSSIVSRPTKDYILYVGRLFALKGLMDLLRAFKIILARPEFSALELHVLGEGPLMGKMKRLTKSFRLSKNVVFFGTVRWQEVFPEMENAKVLVHPSYYESRAVTIDEAQEITMPIVVPELPWATEQCAGYPYVKYYEPGNILSLSEQVIAWLENPPVRHAVHRSIGEQDICEVLASVALEDKNGNS